MLGNLEDQIRIEEQRKEAALNKYINTFYKNLNNGSIVDTPEGNMFITLGFPHVVKKIEEFIATKTTGTRKKDKDYLLNLCDDPKILAYITLSHLLPSVVKSNNKVPIASAANNIMRGLHVEYGIQRVKENDPKIFKYMDSAYRRASKSRKASLVKTHIKNLADKNDELSGLTYTKSQADTIRIGTHLVECVLASGIGVFAKGMVRKGHKTYSILYMTDEGKEILTTSYSHALRNIMHTHAPLVIPPKPWTNNRDGGMYTKDSLIMKMKTPAGWNKLKEVNLTKVYPVLNKLQNTKWRINTYIVDVIHDILNADVVDPRSPKKLPRLHGGLPTNKTNYAEDIIDKHSYGKLDDDDRFINTQDFVRWRRDTEAVTISLDGEMGRRLQLIAALGEAQEFMDYDELYFAYTLDSRGRVYTQQAVITPQGPAEIKAMLEFAEGQMLDDRGLYWLKIHTANVYGNDKEDFDERIRWFDKQRDAILACADSPLSTLGTWSYCDSPFEFLAACKAYKDYTEGKPVHLGIQLDATNSGVQIYSGLLGDLEGAKTVNVVNTGKREDVYGIVAEKVNQLLREGRYPGAFEVQLSDGTTKRQSTQREAKSLVGNISRSIVKRNVMTVPYSVSRRGMSQQLWDIIDDARLQEKEWWEGDPWVVNKLLTDLNHEAIYDTIKGAKVGQDYLVALADLCNGKDGMYYTTPIYDIPVVQKKPRMKSDQVKTVLGMLSMTSVIPNSLDKIAQRNGSAPNYIHSIDSTLLLRVIETMSVQIGVIHDCFIVPPNSGDEVQTKFKEAYVEIMRMKPLELLGKQLDPDGTVEVPYIGTLNLDDVLDSEYIIS